jgi:hypothetical protein
LYQPSLFLLKGQQSKFRHNIGNKFDVYDIIIIWDMINILPDKYGHHSML